jgi:hypothetical protein
MKIIEKTLCETFEIKDTKRIFFLDIETSGLSKYMHSVFCIGVVFKNGPFIQSIQWIASSESEEIQLLQSFYDFCKDYHAVYTYRGKSFDLPFLIARFKNHFLPTDFLEKIQCMDVSVHPFIKEICRSTGSSRLNLETSIGYNRTLRTSGKDLVKLYTLYMESSNLTYENLFLQHNLEEIKGIIAFKQYLDWMEDVFSSISPESTTSSLPFSNSLPKLPKIEKKENDFLYIHLPCSPFHSSFSVDFLKSFKLSYTANDSVISFVIFIYRGELSSFITTYKDYYYIPSKQEIIHKSLAGLIPSSLRRKAKKEECTLKKEGGFIPLPFKSHLHSDDTRIWIDDEKNTYLLLEDFLNGELLQTYLFTFKKLLGF